jgi:LysM repeat protein
MKRISFLLATLVLCAAPAVRAQDAATQERLDKLAGRIEDLTAGQEALKKQISDLSHELDSMREQLGKPNTSYVRHEDLTRLAEDIKAVDQKRIDDAEKVRTELQRLRNAVVTSATPPKKAPAVKPKETTSTSTPATSDKGYEYVVKSGDTLDAIALAYKEKDIKVTVAQILAANPGLKAERLRVGQKIFIPKPPQ